MAKRRRSSRKGGGGGGGSSSSSSCSREEELVKIEIDAAEALAEFCNAWLPAQSEQGTARLQWLCKRKRSGLCSGGVGMRVMSNSAVDFPVKDEYPSEDSDKERLPLVAYNRFETSEDSLEPAESPSSPLPGYSKYVKSEARDDKPSRWSAKCRKAEDGKGGRRAACSKGRSSKTAVTEEEKEQRRLRRIEANRESARQTIRRKQKMCEEMTLKANELTSENDRIRQEIEAVRAETKRMYESSCSLRKQLELATGGVLPALTCSSDDSAPAPERTSSCSKSREPVIQQVQVNRQDDNVVSVDFPAAPPNLEPQRSCSSSSAAGVYSSYKMNSGNRPLQQVTQGAYRNAHFTAYAKMAAAQNRGFFPPQQQQQQPIYSFYPGKTIAAENRRRRKELKQTRLFSRQVTLNS